MMGKWDGSLFGSILILSGITAAGTGRRAILHGFSGPAPYFLLVKAVLTV